MSNPPVAGSTHRAPVYAFGEGAEVRVVLDDYSVFFEGALPGERVRVKVTHTGPRYGHGTLVAIEEPSPDRVEPECVHYGVCGGCDLQHLAWPQQGEFKRQLVARMVARALSTAPELLEVFPTLAPNGPWGHRGKIGLRFTETREGLDAGLLARRSHEVVPLRMCPVQDEVGNDVAFHLMEAAHHLGVPVGVPGGAAGLRALLIRVAPGTGEVGVIFVGTTPHLPALSALIGAAREAGAVQVAYNHHPEPGSQLLGRRTTLVWGKPRLTAHLPVLDARTGAPEPDLICLISPGTFFQTSSWGAATLVDTVRQAVAPGGDVLDLYCGGGLLTLGLARHVRRIVGIEESATSVDDARKSLKLNGFTNVEFIAGRVETRLHAALAETRFPTIVLDPPRAGAEPEVLEALVRHQPRRIVYVACDPHGLARDAVRLADLGYHFCAAQPIDMFPQTADVETVAIFEPR